MVKDAPSPGRERLLIRSMAIAGGLTGFKIIVFILTNSIAILASAADSFMDLVVSAANFILLKMSSKPADHNHPYGHGKFESLAGMAQSLIIGGMVLGVAFAAIQRLLSPQSIERPGVGMAVTAFALVLNLWHTKNLRKSMVETRSQVMATEYLHYATDTLLYFGVLLSFGLFKMTGQGFWDPVISLLIVGYLFKAVIDILRQTLTELLDEQLPPEALAEIDRLIRAFDPRIDGYHDLRTRKVGPTKFIEFHVALRGVEKFRDAHGLTVGLMEALGKKYPGAIVTVHADPADEPA